ncbi:hypothetical protein CEP52_011274 [Fusarium oligoseptatum]|uniref:Uncharacterized protein n=1 Tax=Fusarium oligoseptatum TaxID=2604345 RepID=A0A428T424_9HYPO|nr:hypothetical protein CEP52_011274 [Fusarium oligoseptatum]
METDKCLSVLRNLPQPAQRHARALDVITAKLDEADTEEESQFYLTEKRRLIFERESGLQKATRDWHDETDDVVKDLMETVLNPILKEIEFLITQRNRHPTPADPSGGTVRDASPSTPTMPATPVSETHQPQGPCVASTTPAADEPSKKRKASPSRSPAPKRQRRRREKRTITFAEVFGNGDAPVKRLIVQYPPDHGKWYIIRCRRHDVNFKENPLKAASRHICQSKHPNMPRDYSSVIGMMGYEVLNCDETLAEKNNAVAREAFGIRSQPRSADSIEVGYHTMAPVSESPYRDEDGDYEEEGGDKFKPTTSSSTRRRSLMAITDPTPGEVYQVYWRMLKKWTAAVILPLEDLERFGIEDSIESLGLLKSLPSCYTHDSLTKTFQWNRGYETGGKQVSKREFPVMFFNGSPFPDMSEVAWVPAKDLKPPEICALEPDIQRQVLDYLASKEAGDERVGEEGLEEEIVEEERGVEEESERTDSGREKSPPPTVPQNLSIQRPVQTNPTEKEAAETSQPVQNVEPKVTAPIVIAPMVTAPIVIDLTGEDSSDDEVVVDKDATSSQEQPVDSTFTEIAADEQPVPEESDTCMHTMRSSDSTITDPPTPVVAQFPVHKQQDVPGLQPTPSMTPEATLVAQLACRMIGQGFDNGELQILSQQADSEQALQHSRLERPLESPRIAQSLPNPNEDQRSRTIIPMIQDMPRHMPPVHHIPRPQTVGPSPGRLPELRVQTNHQDKSDYRLPSIRNLIEPPQVAAAGNCQPERVIQSPMMPPSPYTPGCSIPNHLRPDGAQPNPTQAMLSPQLTPRATAFRSWNWLSCFTQPVAEQLQLASGSPAPASPRDFMDHMGRFECPFCRIHVSQLDHFNQHLQHPCRSIPVGQFSPDMSAVMRG